MYRCYVLTHKSCFPLGWLILDMADYSVTLLSNFSTAIILKYMVFNRSFLKKHIIHLPYSGFTDVNKPRNQTQKNIFLVLCSIEGTLSS